MLSLSLSVRILIDKVKILIEVLILYFKLDIEFQITQFTYLFNTFRNCTLFMSNFIFPRSGSRISNQKLIPRCFFTHNSSFFTSTNGHWSSTGTHRCPSTSIPLKNNRNVFFSIWIKNFSFWRHSSWISSGDRKSGEIEGFDRFGRFEIFDYFSVSYLPTCMITFTSARYGCIQIQVVFCVVGDGDICSMRTSSTGYNGTLILTFKFQIRLKLPLDGMSTNIWNVILNFLRKFLVKMGALL